MKEKALSKRLVTVRQAATYLGRSPWAVHWLIHQGELPFVRTGKKMYIDVSDLDAYIDRNKRTWSLDGFAVE